MEFPKHSNSNANARGPSETTITTMPRLSTTSKDSNNINSILSDPYKVRMGSEIPLNRNNSSDRDRFFSRSTGLLDYVMPKNQEPFYRGFSEINHLDQQQNEADLNKKAEIDA